MFNRVDNPRVSFGLCLMVGLVVGFRASRGNNDVTTFVLPAMTIFAALRLPGDVDQRTSHMVGMVIGILAGAMIRATFRNDISTSPAVPRRLG